MSLEKAAAGIAGWWPLRLAGIAAVVLIVVLSLLPDRAPPSSEPQRVYQGLFSKDANGFAAGGHLSMSLADDRLGVRLQSIDASFSVNAPDPIATDEDYQVAFSFGPPGMKLYVNGILTDADPFTGGIANNREPIVIGALEARSLTPADLIQSPFRGRIDSVDLYDDVLNGAEIELLAQRKGVSHTSASDATSQSARVPLPEPTASLGLPEVDGIPASIVVLPHDDEFAIDQGTLVVSFNWNGFEAPPPADEPPRGISAATVRGWSEHFVAYLITAAVIGLGMRVRRHPAPLIVGLLCVSAVMEVLQIWSTGREPSVLDFLASGLGAALGAVAAFRLRTA